MKDNTWYTLVAGAIALSLVAGVVVGWGAAGVRSGGSSNTSGNGSNAPVDYLVLTVAWNPTSGLDEYFPGNFSVPSHTLVQFTINSYDDGANPVVPAYRGVAGTVGGSEVVNVNGVPQTLTSLPGDGIAHTFTVLPVGSMDAGMAGTATPIVNAVIPPAASVTQPVTVTFSAYFNETGTFLWMCMAPCDDGSMATPGLMTGAVTVTTA